MTKEQAFKDINDTQNYYVNRLVEYLLDKNNDCYKEVNFTSDTGTGKTRMMALLCNRMPDKYFIITTLSKGQLHIQIKNNLDKDVKQLNYRVFGLCDFKSNSKLTEGEILGSLPEGKDIVWVRDEGHIHTNRWQEVLSSKCWKVINFSATNKEEGIKCNFAHTMMLRTVCQQVGTPENALDKLLEVKLQHKKVKNYNPCAIVRALDEDIEERVIKACENRGLKYINITEENFDMSNLCEDNNEYDVIINKFKIVEGIDLRRAHVLYMTNEPSNPATTIQIIGRCRRNALLYRDDIDIFQPENNGLLESTRKCYVYYNVQNMHIDTDGDGNLCTYLCDRISCEKLKPGSIIEVKRGVMENGLTIVELEGKSGKFTVEIDKTTGFNIVNPSGGFYKEEKESSVNQYIYIKEDCSSYYQYNLNDIYTKLTLRPLTKIIKTFNYATGENREIIIDLGMGYDIDEREDDKIIELSASQVNSFLNYLDTFNFKIHSKSIRKTYCKLECYSNIKPKDNYFDENDIINIDLIKDDSSSGKKISYLNKYLFKLFYNNIPHVEKFNNVKELNDYVEENANKSRFIYPYNMLRDTPYTIKYRSNIKIHPTGCLQRLFSNCYTFYSYTKENNSLFKDGQHIPLNKINEIEKYAVTDLTLDNLKKYSNYVEYTKTINDKESAIIGVDLMRYSKNPLEIDNWVEDKSVTSKISKYSKLKIFIYNKYKNIINKARDYIYGKDNKEFDFDKRCNKCLGYCAEYYGKYLVYGESFLDIFIKAAQQESKYDKINNNIIIRACMLMYKNNMIKAFGKSVEKVITTISMEKLIQSKYGEFVNKVIELGENVARFIKKEFNINHQLQPEDKMYDPNLSIKHINGLADFINNEEIVDIKCTNSITINHIYQVLAYHYLSTKRTDLNIKRLAIFDAINNKALKIDLESSDISLECFKTNINFITKTIPAYKNGYFKLDEFQRKIINTHHIDYALINNQVSIVYKFNKTNIYYFYDLKNNTLKTNTKIPPLGIKNIQDLFDDLAKRYKDYSFKHYKNNLFATDKQKEFLLNLVNQIEGIDFQSNDNLNLSFKECSKIIDFYLCKQYFKNNSQYYE